ncbi:hypothetical protein SLA2020_303720 [Shorea laevis]
MGGVRFKGKSLRATLCKSSLGAVVYNVWRQRNDILHGNPIKTEERIVKQIVWQVRNKIMSRGNFGLSRENVDICHNWNLPATLLVWLRMAVLISLFVLGAVFSSSSF